MLLSARASAVVLVVMASPAQACPNMNALDRPYFGEINLSVAYGLDPFTMSARSTGTKALRDCGLEGEGLIGYDGEGKIDDRPDVVLHLQRGFQLLAISYENEDDTLLLIRDPEGGWHFNDNGRGQHPLVVFTSPPMGDYVIFTGINGWPHVTPPGQLIFTETGF